MHSTELAIIISYPTSLSGIIIIPLKPMMAKLCYTDLCYPMFQFLILKVLVQRTEVVKYVVFVPGIIG